MERTIRVCDQPIPLLREQRTHIPLDVAGARPLRRVEVTGVGIVSLCDQGISYTTRVFTRNQPPHAASASSSNVARL